MSGVCDLTNLTNCFQTEAKVETEGEECGVEDEGEDGMVMSDVNTAVFGLYA